MPIRNNAKLWELTGTAVNTATHGINLADKYLIKPQILTISTRSYSFIAQHLILAGNCLNKT